MSREIGRSWGLQDTKEQLVELDEWLVGSVDDCFWVHGDGVCISRAGDLSLGRNDLSCLSGFGLDLVVVLDSLDEGLSGVGDSDVLDSHVQELVFVPSSDLLEHVDADRPLVHREYSAWSHESLPVLPWK